MKLIFVILLVSGIFHKVLMKAYPEHFLYSKGNTNSIDEIYDSYLTVSDNKDENNNAIDTISSGIQQMYLNKLGSSQHDEENVKPTAESRRVERTAYFHVKTTRQKDKRYVSYLTLCHFKICNMGRKRTTRYFHMIRSLDNDK